MAVAFMVAIATTPLSAATRVKADELPLAVSYPEYVTHLRGARECLGRGDRPGAVAALQKAQEALAACIRQEARDAVGLAASGPSVPAI